MTMEERMHITELARAHWPGIMVNNVSAASYQDALALLEHSQQPIAGAEVPLVSSTTAITEASTQINAIK